MNYGSKLPGEHLIRALSGGSFSVPASRRLSHTFISPRKYEGKVTAAVRMSGLHFLRSVFILSQFDFVFQKVPKPCTFKGSGDHRNTKEDWELIFGRSCIYFERRVIEMSNWLGLDISFFDMIFSFYRSADFVEMLAVIRPLILGGGEEVLNTAQFTGTVSLGFAVSGCGGTNMRKEILLAMPLISMWDC